MVKRKGRNKEDEAKNNKKKRMKEDETKNNELKRFYLLRSIQELFLREQWKHFYYDIEVKEGRRYLNFLFTCLMIFRQSCFR